MAYEAYDAPNISRKLMRSATRVFSWLLMGSSSHDDNAQRKLLHGLVSSVIRAASHRIWFTCTRTGISNNELDYLSRRVNTAK